MSDLLPFLFWEKQDGQLCAQHCLNSLLQGELFTAVDLSIIARELDQAEQAALQEGITTAGLSNTSTISQNMDDTGFFSVQVLSHALKVWNLEIIPIGSEECKGVRAHPENEVAYICNLREHWFTLRKFGGSANRWYNLDSLLHGPEWISQTYLGMLLNQLENDGYSIFVVRGALQNSQADEYAEAHPESLSQRKAHEFNDDIDQAMIDAAIAASLETSGERVQSSSSNMEQVQTSNQLSLEELRAQRLARFG